MSIAGFNSLGIAKELECVDKLAKARFAGNRQRQVFLLEPFVLW